MYIFRNAMANIKRSKGRSVLFGIIVFIIALSACLALSVRQAAETTRAEGLKNLSITGSITLDMDKAIGEGSSKRPSKSEMKKNFQAGQLSLTELKKYSKLSSVKSFYYTGTASANAARIDAVSSSRFLTKKKSDELKKKLTGLASVHQRKLLTRHIYTTNVVKQRNESIYYTVDRINDAIEAKRKINFRIIEFDGNRRKTHRNDGEVYVVSPYAMYWNDDFYYVVGWSDKHQDVAAFRADRMDNLEILEERAVKRPKGFKISDYSHKVFEMFNGEDVAVKLQCKDNLMKYVIDRFGDRFPFEPGDDGTFTCEVNVRLSPTFYGWVFGFGGDIRILSPEEAVNNIIQMSEDLIAAESVKE